MIKKSFYTLLLLAFVSCGQQSGDSETAGIKKDTIVQKKIDDAPAVVNNRSFIAVNGEKFLRLELLVNASLSKTWDAFATEDGMKTWMAPVAQLDLRVGGVARTNYDTAAKITDKRTIVMGIINYIPKEMLTYKVTLNEVFPIKCRNEDKDLQEIVQFDSVGENKTKIVSTMIGWKEGKEWNDTYSFFEKGNTWTYEQLLKIFLSKPMKQ